MTITWIAVDWGTTRLRAWAMRGTDVVQQASSDRGLATLEPGGFEAALLELITPWLGDGVTDVLACGMVGARQGWIEAPYVPVPAKPGAPKAVQVPGTDPRLRVLLLPGLSQKEPPDVMRGEETQIAGFLRLNAGWDGVICLPGTHTKWAQVSADEVVSFRTFMTGELFNLLARQSILRHSVDDGWDDGAFASAVDDMLSRPEALAARLFGLRSRDLLQDVADGATAAALSGLLIGAELAASRPYWLGQQVSVIGADAMARLYVAALAQVGVPATLADVDRMTLEGLTTAYKSMRDAT